ncbi:wings apart-like protein 2 [Populus nigra]|uniref:wings apart-like protein 2 n=1 Tax=Populus nigra TaxID=3691 RepID=UPI002B278F17|nr:wings apart-like protein 2 [Populus nigra]
MFISLSSSEGSEDESRKDVIPLLCSIFLANQGAGDAAGEGNIVSWNDEAAVLQGEKEAEKMIVELIQHCYLDSYQLKARAYMIPLLSLFLCWRDLWYVLFSSFLAYGTSRHEISCNFEIHVLSASTFFVSSF